MAVTAGALSQVSVSPTTASLLSGPATAGTGPYTYQWYKSTTTGFSPGGGNIIAGATALALNDSGLIPNTGYFYKVVATDTGASNATSTSAQLAVQTSVSTQQPNAFSQSAQLGMIDMRFDYNTISVQIDSSQATPIYAGSAVKIVDSAGGVPKVVSCSANSDVVFGFINYDIKTQAYLAGASAELSMAGNKIYLYATGAIARGAQVCLDLTTAGGVQALSGSGGENIVGYAFDKAPTAGTLIRVSVNNPSFTFDGV